MKLPGRNLRRRSGRGLTRSLAILSLVSLATFVAALPAGASPLGTNTSANGANKPIVHGVPQVPLSIDGKSVNPSEITNFNGRPLYMVALPEPGSPGRLAAFTSRAAYERAVRAHGGPVQPFSTPAVAAPGTLQSTSDVSAYASGYSLIYEDPEFAGHGASLLSGQGVPDLTKRDMSCFLWMCTSWNDQVSSAVADNINGESLYEHIYYEGSVLFIPGGYAALDLWYYGWDNRTSSFVSW